MTDAGQAALDIRDAKPAGHPTVAAPKAGLLLVNLGTPDAAEPGAVRRYLAEFLSDERIVDLPRALWLPVLHGIILNVRPTISSIADFRRDAPAASRLPHIGGGRLQRNSSGLPQRGSRVHTSFVAGSDRGSDATHVARPQQGRDGGSFAMQVMSSGGHASAT